MTTSMNAERVHEETRELIPWWVNGRLTEAESRQVESHLQQCAECRADAEAERRVLAAMRHPSQVAYAPQVSLQKLWQRIDQVEPGPPSTLVDLPRSVSPPSARVPRLRWQLAATVVLGVAVGLVARDVWWTTEPRDAAQFRTVTTPPPQTARPAQIRVVFAPAVTVDELAEIVGGNGYSIVDGPSESGVYGIAAAAGSAVSVTETLARLRADPRVRFAEPAAGAGSITEQ